MKAPCKNCADRKLHCHSTCEKYLEFANAKEEEREKQHKEKLKRFDYIGLQIECREKRRRRH